MPAMAVQRPWVLDGQYRVDGESFEINPVTWYTLAGATASRSVATSRPGSASRTTSRSDAAGWPGTSTPTGAGSQARSRPGLESSDEPEFGGEVLEWVALGVARMLYTFETGDVTSKSGAAAGPPSGSRPTPTSSPAPSGSTRPGSVGRDLLARAADVTLEIVTAVTGS